MGDGARILVAEDNAGLRRLIAGFLTRGGHEVIEAADGAEACRICRDVDVDLVILDLFMPVQDGIETMVELRAFAPGIPIIAMSGGGADVSPRDLLNASELLGAARSIKKPFTMDEMLEAVRKVLGGRTK